MTMKIFSGFFRNIRLYIFGLSFGSISILSFAAEDPVRLKRIEGNIDFDGLPTEESWNSLDEFPLIMHKPNFGMEASERSIVRIGYDDEYLWIAADLFMKDPEKIYAVTKKRDEMLFDYDAFGIVLDTYNDNENALAFYTTPTGLRTDYAVSNDGSGGGAPRGSLNSSWNTFWDVETVTDNEGWHVEMRIPFSSLKFKPVGDVATMGLIITRNISSNNESDSYPAIDPKYGYMALNKPSLAQTIEIEGARPTRPLYVSPYVLGGFTRNYALNSEETSYEREDEPKLDAGIDIKYNINSNLTLDVTANTDFAQVEADDQMVNLTRFSLFFPEKRMFFQERSSLFNFGLGGFSDNLFYSRNIGISDGNPIRILGGARLTGRLGKWDMGFLDMQTAESGDQTGENFGVLRMRRQVINQNSYVGGIVTSRLGMDGRSNLAYGVDGIFRVFGDDYLNVKWSQAYDNETGEKLNSLDPSFILLDWERRSEKGFAYNFSYTYSGTSFTPGIGFVRRGGVQGPGGQLFYGWIPDEKSKLFNYNINVRAERLMRIADGKPESMFVMPGFEFNTKKGIRAEVFLQLQKENVPYDFSLSDNVSVFSGDYSYLGSGIRFSTSENRMFSARINANFGQFYDGSRIGIKIDPTINISSSINVTAMYEFNAIRFPSRVTNNSLTVHAFNVKALYMMSTKLSASFFVQYANTYDEMVSNFRLRYNPREGNDFYIVFNDYRSIAAKTAVPEPPKYFNETVMVKYVHTFIIR